VVVHEKHKKIGYNPEGRRCGEAHSVESIWKKWKPLKSSIFNEIKIVETTVGNKKYVLHREPDTSYILNRQEFICQLEREAEKLGAEVHTDDKIKSVDDLDGDYIVDASGCPSSIKRELGLDRGIRGFTYQQTLEDCNWFVSDTIKIIFIGSFGYYWIFPRDPIKKEVNLGIGAIGKNNVNLKNLLEDIKKEQDIRGKINYVLGGLVPSGLQRPLQYKNIIFVGDAGVGAFPLTGQGIYRALLSGDTAGRCIARGYPEKYSQITTQDYIKWDVIGKNYIRLNHVLKRIGPKAVLTSLKYFIDLTNVIFH
jgi:flavin-dependent dehydrogenase